MSKVQRDASRSVVMSCCDSTELITESPAEAGEALSAIAEQPLRENCLHVTSTVRNEIDHNALFDHSVDQPIRFEEDLAIVVNPQLTQLFR